MNICVTGHYYWSEVYSVLDRFAPGHNVHIIGHTNVFPTEYKNLQFTKIPDIGLDAGKYDSYIKNIWDGKEGVFFMHDDVFFQPEVDPFAAIQRLVKGRKENVAIVLFYGIAVKRHFYNNTGNTRTFFINANYLQAMLDFECTCKECKRYFDKYVGQFVPALPPHRGFFYDPNNPGVTFNEDAVPDMRDINVTIRHLFDIQWKALNKKKKWKKTKVLNSVISYGLRGKYGERK